MNATEREEKFWDNLGLTEEEKMELSKALSQRTKEKIEDMLKPKEETGAIEFLKHAKRLCGSRGCHDCPLFELNTERLNYKKCKLSSLYYINDNEIADLVREVERWWRENGENK